MADGGIGIWEDCLKHKPSDVFALMEVFFCCDLYLLYNLCFDGNGDIRWCWNKLT
ncbi:UNVERIFIED_CONTAM: hypothetical protein Sradi_1004200 [Sesamum radiatum]|uniref:Uncharacterized protein n=1 Tax=Sesamum radiatum TaxID=300843 RepID=A0AAW2V6U0_SESRA